jgi:isoleucyl-tRNA synthetase
LPCACGGEQRRVPDVLDCWFESGAMPFASLHAPFENAARFRASFPADFVAEYVAQTRGWFYTMLVLSTALFDEPPFKNAVCHGVLLGEDGRKMSKRLRNYPDPMTLVAEHGSDALRVALLTSGVVAGADVRFSAAAVRDAVRRLHLPWWNALHLVTTYAASDGYVPSSPDLAAASTLDRALWSETELLRAEVERAMTDLDFARVYEVLEDFVTALSSWYLRLAKPTLWRDGLDAPKRATYDALFGALAQLSLVAAPFLPFLADAAHGALGHPRSVHLEDWPTPRDVLDEGALVDMRQLRAVVRLARYVREQAGVKHRQPLRTARVAGLASSVLATHRDLLVGELNVKTVEHLDVTARRDLVLDYAKLGKRLRAQVKDVAAAVTRGAYTVLADGTLEVAGVRLAADEVSWRTRTTSERGSATRDGFTVELDLTVDDALQREATARELARAVQDLRKRARLRYGEPVRLSVVGDDSLASMLDEHAPWLAAQCSATVTRTPLTDPDVTSTVELAGVSVALALATGDR